MTRQSYHAGNATVSAFRKFNRALRKANRQMQAFIRAHETARQAQWQAYWHKTAGLEKQEDGNNG